jgi:DNA adenine methylase
MALNQDSTIIVKPFLRWAGGKRWLINQTSPIMPKSFNTYIEPFLGSGAVFFSAKNISSFILSDINQDLINCYQEIQKNYSSLEILLNSHLKNHSTEYYYIIRSTEPSSELEQAARFLYLNRTCFNGLYRVNRSGKFNVPIGTTPVTFPPTKLKHVSKKLSLGRLVVSDFEKTISSAKADDFIFVDPPYTVNHNLNGFIEYNENIFSWDDQVRLKNSLINAKDRGVMITLTNANHESIRDLYSDVDEVEVLERPSLIAGKSTNRKLTTEILIRMGWSKLDITNKQTRRGDNVVY